MLKEYFFGPENQSRLFEYTGSCVFHGESNGKSREKNSIGTEAAEECKQHVTTHNIKRSTRHPVICYIAKLRDYPGKLLPKVAMSLGVPKGPMFRMLKDGKRVTLPCGKIITPEEVTEAPIIGPSFLVVDCPGKKYIQGVIKNETLREFQVRDVAESPMVIHMVEEDVVNDSLYQNWMSSFPRGTYHCVLDRKRLSQCPSVYSTQYAMQHQLHQVHPDVFPLIETWRNPYVSAKSAEESEKDSMYLYKNLSKFNLRPKKSFGVDSSEELKQIDVEKLVKDTREILKASVSEGISIDVDKQIDSKEETKRNVYESSVNDAKHKRILKDNNETQNDITPARKIYKCDSNDEDSHSGYKFVVDEGKGSFETEMKRHEKRFPSVVFLGTGSSIPSKYRNVSSILLHVSSSSSVLLDCGEGSYGQIVNHYGEDSTDVVGQLKMIFISHLHADHHLGVIRILKQHWKQFGEANSSSYTPLLIAGPQRLSTWLKEYAISCESLRYRFVDCAVLVSKSSISTLHQVVSEFSKIDIVPVDHHTEAYGIVLSHKDGWKITYSGDTEPCQNLVDAGKDSSLLIHEATFEDGMEEEAREKHHSTCGEALEIAEKMNAKSVLLTHFSQRYAKLPIMKTNTPVAVAFDHMHVHLDDVPKIGKLLPKLQVLFPEETK